MGFTSVSNLWSKILIECGVAIFRSKLKLNANLLGSLHAYSYLCTQNNGRVPFIGIGVSPIGRVVRFVAALFLCLVRGIYLKYVSCSYIMQRYEGSEKRQMYKVKINHFRKGVNVFSKDWQSFQYGMCDNKPICAQRCYAVTQLHRCFRYLYSEGFL